MPLGVSGNDFGGPGACQGASEGIAGALAGAVRACAGPEADVGRQAPRAVLADDVRRLTFAPVD